jgi:hypothetical protein
MRWVHFRQLMATSTRASSRVPPAKGSPRSLSGLLPFCGPTAGASHWPWCSWCWRRSRRWCFPLALRALIDNGLVAAAGGKVDPGAQLLALRNHFFELFGVAAALGLFSAGRFYMVSWLGERVTTDLRNAVYAHVVRQSPEFFETTQTGEVLSRLTGDTTLVQTVVGSSLSMGLRNVVMGIGALGMLVWTNPYVMTQVLGILVLVVLPSVWFGRRVRKLSRASQDRVADASAIAAEVLNAIPVVQSYTAEAPRGRALRRVHGQRLPDRGAAHQGALGAGGLHHHRHFGGAAVGPVPGHAGGDARRHQRRPPGPDRCLRDHPGQRHRRAGRGVWRPAARRGCERAADGTAGHRVADPVASHAGTGRHRAWPAVRSASRHRLPLPVAPHCTRR